MRKLHVEGEQVASRDSDDNENGAENAATESYGTNYSQNFTRGNLIALVIIST